MSAREGWLDWLRNAPRPARRALLAAWLGWALDGFDVMLYALVLGTLIGDLALSKATAGLLGSLTLVAAGIGGVLFGLMADRWGRRPALVGSLWVYSVFTFACGLTRSVWQLGVCRFLLGVGMGGEWTSGAALVSESFSEAHRGRAMGLMQSAWSVGYAAAALVVAVVLPRFGWRAVFFVGLAPAFVALWMRRGIDESPQWTGARTRQPSLHGPLAAIFSPQYFAWTALLTALGATLIFSYWGMNLWLPAYFSLPQSQGGLSLSTGTATLLVILTQVGTFLGYLSFGVVADTIGRRRSFVMFLLLGSVLVLAFGFTRNLWALIVLAPAATFFSTGVFSGFGAVTAELYPTAIRATAQGFTYNAGRFVSAFSPYIVGSLAEARGFGVAFALVAAALLLGAATWLGLPESMGRESEPRRTLAAS